MKRCIIENENKHSFSLMNLMYLRKTYSSKHKTHIYQRTGQHTDGFWYHFSYNTNSDERKKKDDERTVVTDDLLNE